MNRMLIQGIVLLYTNVLQELLLCFQSKCQVMFSRGERVRELGKQIPFFILQLSVTWQMGEVCLVN